MKAVKILTQNNNEGVTFKAVGDYLDLDKSAAKRRCDIARNKGYLRNLEDKKGKPARLMTGDPLPEQTAILPPPEELAQAIRGGCTVAVKTYGVECPPPVTASQNPDETEVF